MKVLIAISCILAVASAGFLAGPASYAAVAHAPLAVAHTAYLGPQHLPVIGPNGVPLEPAENVAARAQHAAAHVEAAVRNGDVAIAAPVAYAAAPLAAGAPLAYAAGAPLAYAAHGAILAAPQHLPVIGPNGVPLEPAANVAARAQHAASHIEAKVRNGDLAVLGRKRRGIVNSLAAPLAATTYAAAPLAAHAYAAPLAAHAYAAPAVYAAQPAYLGPQHLPVIGPNGVPLEPAANVAARAQHAHAHVEAAVRNGDVAIAAAPLAAAPAVVAAPTAYLGPQHLPVIGPNGVPLEPAENVAARAQHAASHIEAKARNGDIAIAAAAPLAYAAPLAAPALAYSGLNAHLAAKVAAGIL